MTPLDYWLIGIVIIGLVIMLVPEIGVHKKQRKQSDESY